MDDEQRAAEFLQIPIRAEQGQFRRTRETSHLIQALVGMFLLPGSRSHLLSYLGNVVEAAAREPRDRAAITRSLGIEFNRFFERSRLHLQLRAEKRRGAPAAYVASITDRERKVALGEVWIG